MSRTTIAAWRIALSAALLMPAAGFTAAPGDAPPAAPPKKAAPQTAPTPNAATEKSQASHAIGLSLAKPLREAKLKRGVVLLPELSRGLKDALGGKEVTDEQQQSAQELVRGGSGDRATGSYNMGLAMGLPLHAAFFTADTLSIPDVIKGIDDVLGGADSSTDTQQIAFAYMTKNKQAVGDANAAKAQAFLAANKSKPGIITTASGLQYKILAPGSGQSPKATDTVSVHYTGKLLDGTEFDGTDLRNNEPASFGVNQVIQGWQEALLLMKPGAKYQLFIPPALAYDRTSEDPIPPGSLLVFTVELLKVGAAGK